MRPHSIPYVSRFRGTKPIAVALLLGLSMVGALGAAPAVHAAATISLTTSDGGSVCHGTHAGSLVNGTWSGTTCTMSAKLNVTSTTVFDVGAGVTLVAVAVNDGIVTNGTFNNRGSVVATGSTSTGKGGYGIFNGGTLNNYGTMTATGGTTSGCCGYGILNINVGTVNNYGTITATGGESGGPAAGDGFVNYGTVDNRATITGTAYGGTADGIWNSGTLDNSGSMTGNGGSSGSGGGYGIYNRGTVDNQWRGSMTGNGGTNDGIYNDGHYGVGIIHNNGTMVGVAYAAVCCTGVAGFINNNFGSPFIRNHGTINGTGLGYATGFANYFTIDTYGTMIGKSATVAIYNNGGTINNLGTLTGDGVNNGVTVGSGFSNHGTINNGGTMTGIGGSGGSTSGGYGIYNPGTINNDGTVTGSAAPAGYDLYNRGIISNYCASTLNYATYYNGGAGVINSDVCSIVDFDQSGMPTVGVLWGLAVTWGPFVIPMNLTGTGATLSLTAQAPVAFTFQSPVVSSGTYLCAGGCAGVAGTFPGPYLADYALFAPAITLSSTGSLPGTTVTVTGTGFAPNTGIGSITFAGATPATQTCTAQTTLPDGSFSCDFVVPQWSGSVTVTVSGSDVSSVPADRASAVFATAVTGSAYAVEVSVFSPGGSPVTDATVVLNGASGVTGLGDSVDFSLAVGGTYSIAVSAPGFADYSASVTVSSFTTELNITLRSSSSGPASSGPGIVYTSPGASQAVVDGLPAASADFTNGGPSSQAVDVWFVWYNSANQVVNIGEQLNVQFSAGQTISFTGTYSVPGTYDVKMFVTNSDATGLSASYPTTVVVP